ncbi:unnamed protein product, partial [Iphiclides podalirius]
MGLICKSRLRSDGSRSQNLPPSYPFCPSTPFSAHPSPRTLDIVTSNELNCGRGILLYRRVERRPFKVADVRGLARVYHGARMYRSAAGCGRYAPACGPRDLGPYLAGADTEGDFNEAIHESI